jgi:hypothetical protein
MDKRNIHDKTHYSAVVGQIGRLQTLSAIPVVAGDSLEIDINGAIRLSPLRTVLTLDAKVEVFAFYDKYRNVYGDDWVNMIKDGVNGTSTLETIEVLDSNPRFTLDYTTVGNGSIPKHYIAMYNRIWNDYFRIANNSEPVADDYFTLGTSGSSVSPAHEVNTHDQARFGFRCARLPAMWNTGVRTIDAEDHSKVGVDNNEIDLVDIAQVKASFKNEIDRDWFTHRYRDFMKDTFGTNGVHIDADQRPELLMHSEQFLSGYDVDATGDNIGRYVGKSAGVVNVKIPSKHFNEHGMVWLMALVRFPSIVQEESHYLSNNSVGYKEIAGDPAVYLNERPFELEVKDVHMYDNADTTSLGYHPYGQWYRTQPNRISLAFTDEGVEGYPFINLDDVIDENTDAIYYDSHSEELGESGEHINGYSHYFVNRELAHWNLVSQVGVTCKSIIPPASKSINAGL